LSNNALSNAENAVLPVILYTVITLWIDIDKLNFKVEELASKLAI
jgi:hypothetical protein